LDYIDKLLSKPNLDVNPEFIKNLYDLYCDITDYYGQNLRGQMRRLQGPKTLREGLNSFNFEGFGEIKDRFMNSMNSIGCV
jgi:hypothetical protein